MYWMIIIILSLFSVGDCISIDTTTSITNSTETISTTIESAITSSSTTTTTSSITSSTTTTTSTSTTSSTTSSSTSSTTSSSTSSTTSTTTSSTTTSSTTSTTTTSTSQISSTVTDSSTPVTSSLIKVRSFGTITRAGDSIVGIYNTSAGMSTGCINGSFSSSAEMPPEAIDNLTSTKYLNFGSTGGFNIEAPAPGVDTGFYVTPTISNNSIATALLFATANDSPNRDPITVTLEGSNSNALDIENSSIEKRNDNTSTNSKSAPTKVVIQPPPPPQTPKKMECCGGNACSKCGLCIDWRYDGDLVLDIERYNRNESRDMLSKDRWHRSPHATCDFLLHRRLDGDRGHRRYDLLICKCPR
ncbi:unnamed protein product [Adineta steineri]|uniref:Uncharacterized protein n=2 Tax=Adineta steineri TaxID=433720 RepID=A0A815K4Y8_9BILA|nr:unnamed protein product [Adineta steineri]